MHGLGLLRLHSSTQLCGQSLPAINGADQRSRPTEPTNGADQRSSGDGGEEEMVRWWRWWWQ